MISDYTPAVEEERDRPHAQPGRGDVKRGERTRNSGRASEAAGAWEPPVRRYGSADAVD
jgi:hypothetical protein